MDVDEEVIVKQEPPMGEESVTITGNGENILLSTDRKVLQSQPPLACVDVKCEFQFQENAAEGLVVKKEPQCDNDAYVNCFQRGNDSVNMKDNTEYQIPLTCVEVHDDSKDDEDLEVPLAQEMKNVTTKTRSEVAENGQNLRVRKSVFNEPHACTKCGKKNKKIFRFRSRVLTHTGEKPYLCAEYGRGFKRSNTLNSHMQTHTGVKTHECGVCWHCFGPRGDLKFHELIHTGEMPHMRSFCGKGFDVDVRLKVHTQTHTGEKRYVCIVCDREVCTSSRATKYIAHTAKKPYLCQICGKRFITNIDFRRHFLIFIVGKPCMCSLCGKGFCQRSQLEPHMIKNHHILKAHICRGCGSCYP